MGLRESNDFKRESSEISNEELEALRVERSSVQAFWPELPSKDSLVTFWKASEHCLKFPEKVDSLKTADDSGVLRLEDMLEEVTLKDGFSGDMLKRLTHTAVKFASAIDPRYMKVAGEGRSPFESLKIQENLFKNVVAQAQRALGQVRAHYFKDPIQVLSQFIESTEYYRGSDPVQRKVVTIGRATDLAVIEMVRDAGENPKLRAPDQKIFADGAEQAGNSSDQIGNQEKRPRKKLDYGRPAEVDQGGAAPKDEDTTARQRENMAKESIDEHRSHLVQEQQSEWVEFLATVRNPSTEHERYGGLRPYKANNVSFEDVKALASKSVQHHMSYSSIGQASFQELPRSQVIAESIQSFVEVYLRYFEHFPSPSEGGKHYPELSIDALKSELKEVVTMRKLCERVLESLQGLAELLYGSENATLAPVLAALPDSDKQVLQSLVSRISHGFGTSSGEFELPSELVAVQNQRRALEQAIKIKTEEILSRNTNPKIKYEEDVSRRYKIAEEIARASLRADNLSERGDSHESAERSDEDSSLA
ncbi:MAG: hypothetical protein KDD62_06720 [Bdellovibrionales bacterium]|nr:hypothetical protein [Bdellovibrionales bacterium]